jgi:hypothetical protein
MLAKNLGLQIEDITNAKTKKAKNAAKAPDYGCECRAAPGKT